MIQANRLGPNDVVEVINEQGKHLLSGFITERGEKITVLTRIAVASAAPFWQFDTVELPSNGYIFQRVADASGENGLLHHELTRYIEDDDNVHRFDMRYVVNLTLRLALSDIERLYTLWDRYPDGPYEPRITRHERMQRTVMDGLVRLLNEPSVSEGVLRLAIIKFPLGWTDEMCQGVLKEEVSASRKAFIQTVFAEIPKKDRIEPNQYYYSYVED